MSRTLVVMVGLCALVSGAQGDEEKEPLGMPKAGLTGASPSLEELSPAPISHQCHRCRKRPLRTCAGKLLEFFCYRPPEKPVRGECFEPCCHPPLYAYFLHRCGGCVEDDQGGTPITFSYSDLLEHNSYCLQQGCGCRGCK